MTEGEDTILEVGTTYVFRMGDKALLGKVTGKRTAGTWWEVDTFGEGSGTAWVNLPAISVIEEAPA